MPKREEDGSLKPVNTKPRYIYPLWGQTHRYIYSLWESKLGTPGHLECSTENIAQAM